MSFTTITLDGPAGAGKSTIAKELAYRLKFYSLNTGSIYRTIAYKYLQLNNPNLDDGEVLSNFVSSLNIKVFYNGAGTQCMVLDGVDVTEKLRSHDVNAVVAKISPYYTIREYTKQMQRKIGQCYDIVAEGRDVGTEVFPNATHKFYVTASAEVRAQRRLTDFMKVQGETIKYMEVLEQIKQRDQDDTNREYGALRQAENAILVDTSNNTVAQSVDLLVDIIKTKSKSMIPPTK